MVTTTHIVHSLIHDLINAASPLISSCAILRNKVPPVISDQIDTANKATGQLAKEITELREHIDERLDLRSPTKAASQIRRLASDWEEYGVILSDSISQIQASEITLEDPELNSILNTMLPGG